MPDRRESIAWKNIVPLVLPPQWRVVEQSADGGVYARVDGLYVIASTAFERDGREWLHVSTSRKARLPSWEDLNDVKDVFVGRTRKAVQILPPDDEKINIHQFVLHLWCCLSEDLLPDFRFVDRSGLFGI